MRKAKQNLPPVTLIIIAIGFIAIAGIALLATIYSDMQEDEFMSTAESCTAKVDDVKTYTTRSRTGTGKHRRYKTTTHYDAYVSYTVNGVNYNSIKIPNVSSSVDTGDTIRIYYDPQNPRDARLKSSSTGRTVAYLSLSVFIFIGLVLLVAAIVSRKRMSSAKKQITAQDVIPDSNSINSTATAYNGYENNAQDYSANQDIYNPDPTQTYKGYGENPFDTYNGYSQNDNSNSFNSQQSNSFDTYNGYSQNDNSNSFNSQQSNSFNTYNGYSQNDNSSSFNPQQSNSFDTYNGYSQNNNSNSFNSQQSNSFDTYNGYSQNNNSSSFNSQQSNPFDTYNGYSQNDNSNSFNSQQSNSFDTYNGYSQNDSSKPKSPFDKYK